MYVEAMPADALFLYVTKPSAKPFSFNWTKFQAQCYEITNTISYLSKVPDNESMVPTGSDESNLRTFQGPSQDQISGYKDFYGEFHNADIHV